MTKEERRALVWRAQNEAFAVSHEGADEGSCNMDYVLLPGVRHFSEEVAAQLGLRRASPARGRSAGWWFASPWGQASARTRYAQHAAKLLQSDGIDAWVMYVAD